jgi:hypothetical protein
MTEELGFADKRTVLRLAETVVQAAGEGILAEGEESRDRLC